MRWGAPPPAVLAAQESEKVDLREYHYDMIKFRGLSAHHHELLTKHFEVSMCTAGLGALACPRAFVRRHAPHQLTSHQLTTRTPFRCLTGGDG